MRDEIRVGVIGFGFVSKTFHIPLLQSTPGYRITTVSSSRPADVNALLPDVDVVSDPKALAEHPDVDLVVIASPNDTHAPLAEAAMRAGRNVVVDKPFTITLEQADTSPQSRARRMSAVRFPEQTMGQRFSYRAGCDTAGPGGARGALRIALRPFSARGARAVARDAGAGVGTAL